MNVQFDIFYIFKTIICLQICQYKVNQLKREFPSAQKCRIIKRMLGYPNMGTRMSNPTAAIFTRTESLSS